MFCCKTIKEDSLLSRHVKIQYFCRKLLNYALWAEKKMAASALRADSTLSPTLNTYKNEEKKIYMQCGSGKYNLLKAFSTTFCQFSFRWQWRGHSDLLQDKKRKQSFDNWEVFKVRRKTFASVFTREEWLMWGFHSFPFSCQPARVHVCVWHLANTTVPNTHFPCFGILYTCLYQKYIALGFNNSWC